MIAPVFLPHYANTPLIEGENPDIIDVEALGYDLFLKGLGPANIASTISRLAA
ncbi:MAG: hypothetical protein AAF590_02940 [Pseudomonadota bacterium]